MAWIWLTVAGLLEVVWAIGLKYTDGFTRLWPSAVTIAAMVASVYFLARRGAHHPDRHRLRGVDRHRRGRRRRSSA